VKGVNEKRSSPAIGFKAVTVCESQRAQVNVEIVVDAVAHDPVHVEVRGVASVDLLPFTMNFTLPPCAWMLSSFVARPLESAFVTASLAVHSTTATGRRHNRAPADRVHAVDRPHQEVRVALTGVREALATDEMPNASGWVGSSSDSALQRRGN